MCQYTSITPVRSNEPFQSAAGPDKSIRTIPDFGSEIENNLHLRVNTWCYALRGGVGGGLCGGGANWFAATNARRIWAML